LGYNGYWNSNINSYVKLITGNPDHMDFIFNTDFLAGDKFINHNTSLCTKSALNFAGNILEYIQLSISTANKHNFIEF